MAISFWEGIRRTPAFQNALRSFQAVVGHQTPGSSPFTPAGIAGIVLKVHDVRAQGSFFVIRDYGTRYYKGLYSVE